MTTSVILLILAALWGAYLVPPMVRSRGLSLRFSRTGDIGSYSRSLAGLDQAHARLNTALSKAIDQGRPRQVVPLHGGSRPEPTQQPSVQPTPVVTGSIGGGLTDGAADVGLAAPVSAYEARQRRRMVLIGLAGLALLTLVGALTFGGIATVVHLLVDVALLAWVVLLAQREREAEERRTKVRPIRPAQTVTPSSAVSTHSHADFLRQSGS